MTLVYLVAGEASGDVLGARLMAALRRHRPDLEFAGIGGARMAEQGLESLFPMHELALMGLAEVLPRLRQLAGRMRQTVADIAARRPAVLITIDSPGFAFRLAPRVRPLGIRVIHYVAPQVWAWRPGRVRKLVGKLDLILALLPFEAPFFERAGIPVRFVGHPVLESGTADGDAARFRAMHPMPDGARPLIVMPGSRRSEVPRLLPLFGEALRLAAPRLPGIVPIVPIAGTVADAVRDGIARWTFPGVPIGDIASKHDAFAAVAASDGFALTKSGTSSLELAVAGLPHLVAYRMNPITAGIARRLITVKHASLTNLLAETPFVPEYLQENCTPAKLAEALFGLADDTAQRRAQRDGFAAVLARLRPPEGLPSEAAASAVLEMLEQQQA